jgi:hypothetical protein
MFSVFLLITAARYIPSTIALYSQAELRPSWILIGLITTTVVAVCAYLWFFPLTVARLLLPVMREPRSETSLSGSMAFSVGLTLLGVWVLAYALPDAVYWGTLFLLTRQIDDVYFSWTEEQIASIVSTGAELALAIWLIFGSTGIKRLILRFRYGPSQDGA